MVVDITEELLNSKGPEFSERVVEYYSTKLGYRPLMSTFTNVDGSERSHVLIFRDDTDAMLFKLAIRGK